MGDDIVANCLEGSSHKNGNTRFPVAIRDVNVLIA